MNNTLESHKFFPYVAWALVIGFALFTLNLTLQFRDELTTINEQVSEIEARLQTIEARGN